MKRLIGYTVALCLLAITAGCGGVSSTGTLAYISNSTGTGFTLYTVNTDGTLTTSSISPQDTPAAPKVLQFANNGKWAYFLDNGGLNIYAYVRAGNGTLTTLINTYPVSGAASSLVVAPNSQFLYVALPGTQELAVYSIDTSTGILAQQGSAVQVGYAIDQLVMAPGGNVLFGLSRTQAAIVSWTLNSSSGVVTQSATLPVGISPSFMVLSANGSYMYVPDSVGTTPIYVNGKPYCPIVNGAASCQSSPNIYGYNVSSNGVLLAMAGSPFDENADAITGIYPTQPTGGATDSDTRFLFIANQGSHNVSVFKIATTSGEPSEVLGSTTTVNGIQVSTASPYDCGTTCSTPSFAAVAKANNALYLLDTPDGKIFQLAIDQNTGQLRSLNPAFVSAENATSNPTWITIR
jgi:6-phosphogluconolactonase (cycloisomerase 2 family)